MEKNFVATVLLFGVLTMSGCSINSTFQQPKADDSGVKIEGVYNNSNGLPQHNTVCFPTKKFLCSSSGCKTQENPSTFILIGGGPTMSRCDHVGCDTYEAVMKKSGDFVNTQTRDPRGLIFKMSFSNNALNNKNEFVEVATLGLDTQISYGYCKSAE